MIRLIAGLFAGAFASTALLQIPFAHGATEKVVHSFCQQANCADGGQPTAGLIAYKGTLYGSTGGGGAFNDGTVFSLDVATGTVTLIHSFDGTDGSDPGAPLVPLKGTLYGTTFFGGAHGYGALFALDVKTGVETVLHSFPKNTSDGRYPGGLIEMNGILYGTTGGGGSSGSGTVFSIDPATGAETILHTFADDRADGIGPTALLYVNGTLYGTTSGGGRQKRGTVFSLDPNTGAENILHSFQRHRGDGIGPVGLIYISGKLYGTTKSGGSDIDGAPYGTVFSLTLASGNERVLHSFDDDGVDGTSPEANLIRVGPSLLYGTTYQGGNGEGGGTVFSFDRKTGVETILHAFTIFTSDGNSPAAPLLEVNGTLYGTTVYGGTGANNGGTIFSITP